MTRKVAIIQARISSSRLPGKVLMPLLGIPSIVFMVERVRQSTLLDDVVVATSVETSDDPLAAVLADAGVGCFRGSLHDVLDRFVGAARAARADHVVRLTGDCPLIDFDLIDKALALLESESVDYVSNVDPPTYPDGLDVEAFRFSALEQAHAEATAASDREHVTPFMRNQRDRFSAKCWHGIADLSALRWTVDHQDDLDHVRSLLAKLGSPTPTSFDRFDLYRVCELSGDAERQPDHRRNEGMSKSGDANATGAP
jgi:spore coat polysaccharide biosynthesis protein SpsF (cytidylyltransferase family)